MTKEERAKQHAESLSEIAQMTLIDCSTNQLDHVGTLKERARMVDFEVSGYAATERACDAFERLLCLAETRDSGQIERVARFLAAAWGARGFELQEMRGLDRAIGDDMLAVMDGIRHGRIAPCDMAESARTRVPQVLQRWEIL